MHRLRGRRGTERTMDRLLTRPWDWLTREEQRLALVAARRTGEELAASFDERLLDEWRDRQAERLALNPDLCSEDAVYLDLVVERSQAERPMTPDEVAYWHDHRSQQDPRVSTLAHAWWGRVVCALPLLLAGPCAVEIAVGVAG